MLGLSLLNDFVEPVGDCCKIGCGGRGMGFVAVVGQLGLLRAEVVEAGREVGEALLAALGGEASLLEGVEVAGGGVFGAGDLGGDCLAAFVERGSLALGLLLGGGECVLDEWAVAVDAGELVQDGGLELLSGDALALAGFGAVLLACGAGVVVVEAAFAACGHADVGAAAVSAAQDAGEQEV
ncbi:MAG TPA: hypothetical protein VHT29_00860 [Solirubrobacteraceae bacterium]|nr:hypothetical protein [Solirubrobacteraceae bacterium]